MLKITAIASSSKGNLYIIDNGKSRLLLECGVPWRKIQQALGFDLSNVAGCLVSHSHGDHAMALKDVIKAGIDCYASAETFAAVGAAGHRAIVLKKGVKVKVGDFAILPFDGVHDCDGHLGFLISSGGDRLLFLTDSAYCKYRFSGITHLMLECNFSQEILEANILLGRIDGARAQRLMESHFSFERVKEFLKVNDISKLKEIHLMHLSRDNSDATLFKTEIQKITGVPVYICEE